MLGAREKKKKITTYAISTFVLDKKTKWHYCASLNVRFLTTHFSVKEVIILNNVYYYHAFYHPMLGWIFLKGKLHYVTVLSAYSTYFSIQLPQNFLKTLILFICSIEQRRIVLKTFPKVHFFQLMCFPCHSRNIAT